MISHLIKILLFLTFFLLIDSIRDNRIIILNNNKYEMSKLLFAKSYPTWKSATIRISLINCFTIIILNEPLSFLLLFFKSSVHQKGNTITQKNYGRRCRNQTFL